MDAPLPRLISETPDLLVLAKPAGVPVFPPHADPSGESVHRWLSAAGLVDTNEDWPRGFDLGIAHRLDIPTSGQLLVARSVPSLQRLRAAFSEKRLDKRYAFLTDRRPAWERNTVQHRLAHDRRRKRRMVYERGRSTPHRGRWLDAETDLRLVGPGPAGTRVWSARMRTGVMHQIRVHAASCGLALAGDRLYGGRPFDLPRDASVPFCLHHIGVGAALGVALPDAPIPSFWGVRPSDGS